MHIGIIFRWCSLRRNGREDQIAQVTDMSLFTFMESVFKDI